MLVVYDAKIKDIEGSTADYNKFTSDILDVNKKQKKLFNKSDIDRKLININKKVTANKTKHVAAEKKITALTNKVEQISEK